MVLFLGLNVDIEKMLDINPFISEEAQVTAYRALNKLLEIDAIFEEKKIG